MKKDSKKTTTFVEKPVSNTDDIIKVNEKILLIEHEIQSIKAGLKLALGRMGLHKEFKDGK